MKIKKSRIRFKKRYIIPMIILILLCAFVAFFQLTAIGYRMTVSYRNFTQLSNNVYVANDYPGDMNELISILDQATIRTADFWGSLESSPVIIICDNAKTLQKLGGNHDTATLIFLKAYDYISISSEYLNVDVVAHELTHAELHTRLYAGRLRHALVPTWFDEGIATQNDYRIKYGEAAFKEATNAGSDIMDLSSMDTASEFNGGEKTDRVYRYIVSRHELKEWIARHGIAGLTQLISSVNSGEDFYELYSGK